MTGYPLLLDVSDRRVLVVGGGSVAARRARAVAAAGARVEVVAPEVCDDLREAAATGAVTWSRRPFAADDVDGAWLVHACTDDPAVNAAVAAAADAQRVWCVRADDAAATTASVPAVARRGEVTVAVSGGGDPGRAIAVRDAVQALLDTGALPVRRTRTGEGHVALVGGGPGDTGLLTLRGAQLLAEADVVVLDRLAPRDALAGLGDDVEVIDAGKGPHAHTMTQDEINAALVEHASAGKRVVRLKGGDPFVFGRGGEEVLACRAAGIPVEVVPGVTSAIAVPGAAGIPVTHRRVTQAFTVVSAHADPGTDDSTLDWAALARGGGTLVLLMAVGRLDRVARALVAHGRAADTPVGIVESGTTAGERVTVGTLDTIAGIAAEVGVRPPAVVVIGDVVALRDQLAGG